MLQKSEHRLLQRLMVLFKDNVPPVRKDDIQELMARCGIEDLNTASRMQRLNLTDKIVEKYALPYVSSSKANIFRAKVQKALEVSQQYQSQKVQDLSKWRLAFEKSADLTLLDRVTLLFQQYVPNVSKQELADHLFKIGVYDIDTADLYNRIILTDELIEKFVHPVMSDRKSMILRTKLMKLLEIKDTLTQPYHILRKIRKGPIGYYMDKEMKFQFNRLLVENLVDLEDMGLLSAGGEAETYEATIEKLLEGDYRTVIVSEKKFNQMVKNVFGRMPYRMLQFTKSITGKLSVGNVLKNSLQVFMGDEMAESQHNQLLNIASNVLEEQEETVKKEAEFQRKFSPRLRTYFEDINHLLYRKGLNRHHVKDPRDMLLIQKHKMLKEINRHHFGVLSERYMDLGSEKLIGEVPDHSELEDKVEMGDALAKNLLDSILTIKDSNKAYVSLKRLLKL